MRYILSVAVLLICTGVLNAANYVQLKHALTPLFVADINGSCAIDISNLVYLVDYMFTGGPAPLVGCEL